MTHPKKSLIEIENQNNNQDSLEAALARAQKNIGKAHKDGKNPHFKSAYTTLASVQDACLEALNNEGIAVSQTLGFVMEQIILNTRLLHTSGNFIESICPLLMSKNDMQALGSAITYARRYSLAAICGVVQEDDDGNKSSHKNKDPQPEPQPEPEYYDENPYAKPAPAAPGWEKSRKITQGQADLFQKMTRGFTHEMLKKLLKEFEVDNQNELLMSQFNDVLDRLKEMKKA